MNATPAAPSQTAPTKMSKGQLERFLKIHDLLNDAWHGSRRARQRGFLRGSLPAKSRARGGRGRVGGLTVTCP